MRGDANPTPNPKDGEDEVGDWGDEVYIDCDDLGEDPTCPGYDPKEPVPAEPEPSCDIEFPILEPVWLIEEPSPIAGGLPTVVDMIATDDALYLANWHNANDPGQPAGSVERRTLDGDLLWAVEIEPAPVALAWDGEHIYAGGGERLRRWSGDGIADDWSYTARGDISDIAVNDETVALTGSYWVGGIHDSNLDAFYGQVTKTTPPDYLGYAEPVEGKSDVGEAVGVNPWGGWIVGGAHRYSLDYHVWLYGYGGNRLVTEMRTYDTPHVEAIFPGDDLVYVVGWSNVAPSGRWLSAFDADGTELWSRDLWICPGAGAGFTSLSLVDDALIGVATSRTHADEYPPLVARVGLDGAAIGVWEVSTNAENLNLQALTVLGSRVFVGGVHFDGMRWTRVVMEIQP